MTIEPTGRRRRGVALAAGAAAISGVAVFINGYGVRAVPDATVYTTAKNLVAALLLVAAALPLAAAGRRPRQPLSRARLGGLLAVAVIGGSVPFVLFFEGLSRASSTHAAFVHKTLVIWVALIAVPLLGERVRLPHVAAILLLVAGLVLLDGGLAGFAFGGGELLILAATLLWAVEVVVVKRLLRAVPPATVAVSRMGLGVAVLLGWLAVTGRVDALVGLGATGWLWSLLTGTVLAGYVTTWFAALSRAPAVDVTAVLVAGAVVTGLLSAAVRGTPLAAPDLAGMTLLVAGACIAGVFAGRAARMPAVSLR